MKIGFVGLGVMGCPMAGHLAKAGHELFANNHGKTLPVELSVAGVQNLSSLSELASKSEVIITMVPDTPDVASVLFGEDGITAGLSKGKIVIDMSSIGPIETRDFAARIERLGCGYMDAPVSGGDVGAKNASLTIMCGGKDEVFARVKPILELMGRNITLVGEVGAGQVAKVANQIIVALNIEAVSEALVFASRAGVDPAKVRQALMGGFASSRALEVHGERIIKRSFAPGFRIELHSKDLNLALSSARKLGISLPNTAIVQEMFNSCIGHGDGKKDHSALVMALERMAKHPVG
jgi:2-hydroxy-3-oxopropionate reductase